MTLGDEMLATPAGVAFLTAGEASGRLDAALASTGRTLCLAAHAVAEVARGADGGRLRELRRDPPGWLVSAAGRLDDAAAAGSLDWWSGPGDGAVHRQIADGLTGVELVDDVGRARSLAEESSAHLHTFQHRDGRTPIRRWRPHPDVQIAVVDRQADWDALGQRLSQDASGTFLTLRGALTVEHAAAGAWRWPWALAGVWWNEPVPGTPLPDDEQGNWRHDHDWVAIGRTYDPRFDEGDEVDGSELSG